MMVESQGRFGESTQSLSSLITSLPNRLESFYIDNERIARFILSRVQTLKARSSCLEYLTHHFPLFFIN